MQNANLLETKPDWKGSLKKVWTSDEGSVAFTEFEQGTIFVVKGSSSVVQETYAASVLISAGIPCAAIRVVNSRDDEWSELKSALKTYSLKSTTDDITKTKVNSLLAGPLNRAQLMVIEFVEGVSFDMLYGDKLDSFTSNKDSLLSNCATCGQILAVDLFVQNSDRIPTSVWQNEGNGGNLMINSEQEIFAIDSLITTLDPDKNETTKKYYEAKEKNLILFFEELYALSTAANNSTLFETSEIIQKFKTFFLSYTRIDLNIEYLQNFIRGIVDGVERVVSLIKSNYFNDLHLHMKKMFAVTWLNGWENDLNLIHLNFLERVAPFFIDFADKVRSKDSDSLELNLYFPLSKTKYAVKPKKNNNKNAPAVQTGKRPVINPAMLLKKRNQKQNEVKKPRPPIAFKAADLSGLRKGLKKSKVSTKNKVKENNQKNLGNKPGEMMKKAINTRNITNTAYIKRFNESHNRMFRMNRDSTLLDAIENYNLKDCDLFFFDFDQTLTMPQKVKKMGVKAKLRGEDKAFKILNELDDINKSLFIVTANPPTRIAASSVASEVAHLGLENIFKCNSYDINNILKTIDLSNIDITIDELVNKVLVLFCVLSSRTGTDLYRISSNSVVIADDEITFQLFKEGKDELDYQQLSSSQHIKSKELCILMNHYCQLIDNTTNEEKDCFFKSKDQNNIFQLNQSDILDRIHIFCKSIGINQQIIHQLCYGEAIEFNTSEIINLPEKLKNIKLGASGNLICSKYNKSDAIEVVLDNLFNNNTVNSKVQFYFKNEDELKQKKKLKIAFFDDNASNVFSIYSAFVNNNDVQVFSLWYEPPLVGANELKQNDPIENWVRNISAMSTLEVTPSSTSFVEDNILILQQGPMSLVAFEDFLIKKLEAETDISLVILPEGFVSEVIQFSPDDKFIKAAFKDLCEIARKFQVDIVVGTFKEVCPDKKYYTTSIYIDSSGSIIGLHRKQKIHDFATQAIGEENIIFDTKYGKASILICLDIEDETLLKKVINKGAKIIFNPVHIPTTKSTGSEENQQWRYKLQMMGKYLEKICADNGVTVVRCDMPVPFGSGSSQVITPTFTETISYLKQDSFKFNMKYEDHKGFFSVVPEKSYERTDDKDNNGLRIIAQNLKISKIKEEYRYIKEVFGNPSSKLQAPEILCIGKTKGLFLNPMNFHQSIDNDLTDLLIQFDPPFNSNIVELDNNNFLYLSNGKLIFGVLNEENKLIMKHMISLSFSIISFTLNEQECTIYCLGEGIVSIISIAHNRTISRIIDYISK